MQDRNRDTDIDSRSVDTVGEGEGGTNWKNRIDTYTPPGLKEIASGKLLIAQETSEVSCDDLEGGKGVVRGRLERKGMYGYIRLTHSAVEQKHNVVK